MHSFVKLNVLFRLSIYWFEGKKTKRRWPKCCRCLWCFWCCLERLLPNFLPHFAPSRSAFFPPSKFIQCDLVARPLLFLFIRQSSKPNKHKTWATKQITKKQHYANRDFSSQINSDLVWTRWILWFIKCHLLFFDYTVAGFLCAAAPAAVAVASVFNVPSSLLVVSLSWENIYLYVRATLRLFLSLVCQCVQCEKPTNKRTNQEKNNLKGDRRA